MSDPRLTGLDQTVRDIMRGRLPKGVKGGREFRNDEGVLPKKSPKYYKEYDVKPPAHNGRGLLRLVLGDRGKVYITGNHYRDFRQIIGIAR